MTGSDLIKLAEQQGYKVRLCPDGKIGISPRMPPDTRQVFVTHRLEIIQALQAGKDDAAATMPPEPRKAVLTRRGVCLAAVKKAVADPLEQNKLLRFAEFEARSYCGMFELREQADREWFFCNEVEDYLRDRLGQIVRWQMESDQITGWSLVPIRATASATTKAKDKQAGQGRLI